MNITITGNLGAGKSSVCKELKKQGFAIITGGSIFRAIAKEMNISVEELNRKINNGEITGIDNIIDTRTTELSKQMDNAIFDSRLAWYFIPDSFKVFLMVDPQVAAKRVFYDNNRNAETYAFIEDAVVGLKSRAALEQQRFFNMYHVDYLDKTNYDLILDSSNMTPQQLAAAILDNFERFRTGNDKSASLERELELD